MELQQLSNECQLGSKSWQPSLVMRLSLVDASRPLSWWHWTLQSSDLDARDAVAHVVASCSLLSTKHGQVCCRQDDMVCLQP